MTVYFDMDRVLCDFATQAKMYKVLKKNGRINWFKVFLLGSKFWFDMDFFPFANEYFSKIRMYCIAHNVSVKILSSVRLSSGQRGKMKWCIKNLNIQERNVILVKNARKKSFFASPTSFLIDDNEENIHRFVKNNGHGFKFVSWNDETYRHIINTINFICKEEKNDK